MANIVELYEALKDSLGQKQAKLIVEKFEELEQRIDIEKRLELIEQRLTSIENRIWWIVGLILVQWLSLMMAILFKH